MPSFRFRAMTMPSRSCTLVVGALLLSGACRQAPVTPPAPANSRAANAAPMLVSTSWLAEHASDGDLVLLHVGNKAQYDSGHVAGSRLVSLEEIALPAQPGGLSLQLAGVDQLTAWAVRNGISDRSRVVVIPHDGALQSATRVFITLAYLGAIDRVSLLDGSFQAWKREQRAVTTATPAGAAPVTFTPKLRPELIATIEQVERIALRERNGGPTSGPAAGTGTPDATIIDARLARFYNGDGGGYPRPGHIPTAVNVPLSSVSSNGYLKPLSELKTLFDAAGVDPGKPVITYCHIGQQATLLWFVATMLGLDARMYDGSFQEWSGSTRPVVGPPGQ